MNLSDMLQPNWWYFSKRFHNLDEAINFSISQEAMHIFKWLMTLKNLLDFFIIYFKPNLRANEGFFNFSFIELWK